MTARGGKRRSGRDGEEIAALCRAGGELNRISRDIHQIVRGVSDPRSTGQLADALADIQGTLRLVRAAIETASEGEP